MLVPADSFSTARLVVEVVAPCWFTPPGKVAPERTGGTPLREIIAITDSAIKSAAMPDAATVLVTLTGRLSHEGLLNHLF